MAEFIQPRHDPAASDTDLSGSRQKQDCERNAAKRWISLYLHYLAAYRPVLLGDDIVSVRAERDEWRGSYRLRMALQSGQSGLTKMFLTGWLYWWWWVELAAALGLTDMDPVGGRDSRCRGNVGVSQKVSASKTGNPCTASMSPASRRRLRPSTREARLPA